MAAADDLAVGAHVGADAEHLLDAAGREAEAGDDLVEDEGDLVLGGDATDGADEVHRLVVGVAGLDGLDEHAGDVCGVGADVVKRGVGAVVQHDDVGGVGERDAGGDGGGAARGVADEDLVKGAVVVAGEVDELVACR